MFDQIFQLHKLGKSLGLNKRDINNTLIFNNSRHPTLYKTLATIVIVFIGFLLIFFIILLGFEATKHTYTPGTYYSTVKIRDFKGKRKRSRMKFLTKLLTFIN